MPGPVILLYGGTGYTGRLIAREAAERAVRITLAGRNDHAVDELARRLGLPCVAFELDDAPALRAAVAAHSVVLNCAGPFIHTYRPLVEACLDLGVHYVDITGEIDVLEAIAGEDGHARAAGVTLLPGAGFDVVPSDCLAAHVAARLPGARRLLIGIRGSGRLSRGTAATSVEYAGGGGRVRRGGALVRVPAGWRTRRIDFGDGARTAITIPWGDVATAWHSTGIPDIEVYAAVPRLLRSAVRASRYLAPLLRRAAVRHFLQRRIRGGAAGPSERELRAGTSSVWARAEADSGRAVEAWLHGPNGYALTVHAALEVSRRILHGAAPAGFQTPSRAFGADFVLELPGTRRVDGGGGR